MAYAITLDAAGRRVLEKIKPELLLEYRGVRIYQSYYRGQITSPVWGRFVVAHNRSTTDGIEFSPRELDEYDDLDLEDEDDPHAYRKAIEAAIDNGSIRPGYVALSSRPSFDPLASEYGPSPLQQEIDFIDSMIG